MNITTFTILAAAALFATGLIYKQYRLNQQQPAPKKVTAKAGNGGRIGK